MSQLATINERRATVAGLFDRCKKEMALALPRHLTPDRMARIALSACSRNPQLLECTPTSLAGSIMMAAQLGLEPDGTNGALVPYRNKGKLEAQFIPMYRGLMALAWRSGQIVGVQAEVVRERDTFSYRKGLNATLDHSPYEGDEDAGELTHAYAIIATQGGGYVWSVLNKREVDAIKASSRAASSSHSPWKTHEAEMWKKSALRRALKLAPMSVEAQRAVTEDERVDAGMSQQLDDLVPTDAIVSDADEED